jgi:hypothetical protein
LTSGGLFASATAGMVEILHCERWWELDQIMLMKSAIVARSLISNSKLKKMAGANLDPRNTFGPALV